MEAIALKREPKIRLVDPPAFTEEVAQAIAEEEILLNRHPHQWNGPQLMALEGSAEEIAAYSGSYAHYRAWQRLGKRFPGLGPLGVGIFIASADGLWLWQRTSATHSLPKSWGFGAFGGVSEGSFRHAALKELAEELSLCDDDFLNFGVRGLLLGSPAGAYVVYRGLLTKPMDLCPNRDEVDAVIWVREPLEALSPIAELTREVALAAEPLL